MRSNDKKIFKYRALPVFPGFGRNQGAGYLSCGADGAAINVAVADGTSVITHDGANVKRAAFIARDGTRGERQVTDGSKIISKEGDEFCDFPADMQVADGMAVAVEMTVEFAI